MVIGKGRMLFALILIMLSPMIFSQERVISEYKIGPKDLLEISVYGLEELDKFKVRVEEEGTITIPFLGSVEVDGLTKTGLEKKLKQLLAETILQDPQVTVFIVEYESKKVHVIGAVTNPGPYELLGRQTLLAIISEAGGFTSDAGDKVIVMRNSPNGSSQSLEISLDDLSQKGDASLNIPLEAGDIINVPVDKIIHVFVHGQVRNPGAVEIKNSELGKFTLLQAIASAGGFAERAAKGRIKYTTTDEKGNTVKIKVNAKQIIQGKKKDIMLKEGDIIYVPETIF